MSRLEDYLRVIPKVEKEKVEALLRDTQAVYEVEELTEEAFRALVEYIAEKEETKTRFQPLGDKVSADELNRFFSDVAIDLLHLFEEQELIEGAARNYDRIFSGVADDIRREVEALSRREQELSLERQGEDGLYIKEYGFESAGRAQHEEVRTEENAYLFTDRDGSILDPVSFTRSYHQHYIELETEEATDRLRNEKGQVTARMVVRHENLGVVPMDQSGYGPEKAIDGSKDTHYMHVILSTEEVSHRIAKQPDLEEGR